MISKYYPLFGPGAARGPAAARKWAGVNTSSLLLGLVTVLRTGPQLDCAKPGKSYVPSLIISADKCRSKS